MDRALVVVTTYERPDALRLALGAWRRQTVTDFVLAVADDGSGPATRELVEEFRRTAPFPVLHAWHEHRGFRRAAIVNEAVRRGGGAPLLVVTDGDCLPPARFVERHLAAHGPRSFAVGGAVRLRRHPTLRLTEADVDTGRFETIVTSAHRWDLRWRSWKNRIGTPLRLKGKPKIMGLNFGVDRALFEEVNGFDEAFVGYGLEDTDLRDRLMRSRPRPQVRVLYGANDVWHLWHRPAPTAGLRLNAAYYRTPRPVRCLLGLDRPQPRPVRDEDWPAVADTLGA